VPEENKDGEGQPAGVKDDEVGLLNNDPDKEPEKPKAKKTGKHVPMNTADTKYLDGLRGFGALSVYLQHFIYEMYPYFLYGKPEPGSKEEEDYHDPPVWLQYT
jgi:hypothetical protein